MDAGKRLGLKLGFSHSQYSIPFECSPSECGDVGCWSFKNGGMLKGSVFYGTGGTTEQMKQDPSPHETLGSKFRPNGHDCLITGI